MPERRAALERSDKATPDSYRQHQHCHQPFVFKGKTILFQPSGKRLIRREINSRGGLWI